MEEEIKKLTQAEEQIMQILWSIEKGFIKDIIAKMPAPKPAYSTVSTIVRILVRKGFIKFKAFGNTHEYQPLISEESYKSAETDQLLSNYFDNSIEKLVSFYVEKKNINMKEADEIFNLLASIKNKES